MSNRIKLKSKKEIETLKEGGKILSDILFELQKMLVSGLEGDLLDKRAKEMAEARGAKCSFLGFEGYPANVCFSLNDEVVHGIPFGKVLKEGDVAGVDLGIKYKGLFTDSAFSFFVPYSNTREERKRKKEILLKKKIVKMAFESLEASLPFCRIGFHVGDIGNAVQTVAEKNGFSVVKKLVGHGVGYGVHEDPMVPNYGEKGEGERLKPGMVLAIEPMLTSGSDDVVVDPRDNWTFKTFDGSLSSHFEWTVAITEGEPIILTPLEWVKGKN